LGIDLLELDDVVLSHGHLDHTWGLPEIGLPLAADTLSGFFDLRLSREPVPLTERLTFLGEIERIHDFEAREPAGTTAAEAAQGADDLLDDTALAYLSTDGLVILTGCSHAGICNITDQARGLTGEARLADILGGLHLLDPSERRLRGTIERLEALQPRKIHACHCTDLRSKLEMGRTLPLEDVGVGLRLEYEP